MKQNTNTEAETAQVSPYLLAYDAYHAGHRRPAYTWTDALEFHLQHGALLATPSYFVLARPVLRSTSPEDQLALRIINVPAPPEAWHIWAAAGNLRDLREAAHRHGARWVTFQRRDQQRLHTLRLRPHALLSPPPPPPPPPPGPGP